LAVKSLKHVFILTQSKRGSENDEREFFFFALKSFGFFKVEQKFFCFFLGGTMVGGPELDHGGPSKKVKATIKWKKETLG
jgi:hypothetical protein